MRVAAGWLAVSILLSGMGCAAPRPEARDVVVVVLDTVRRDRTSVYAPGSDTMPFLAEFAEQCGELLAAAHTPSNCSSQHDAGNHFYMKLISPLAIVRPRASGWHDRRDQREQQAGESSVTR